jgi:hypothetical protein
METLETRWEERGRWAMHLATQLHPWPPTGDQVDADTSSGVAAIARIYTAWLYLVTGVENIRIQGYPCRPANGALASSPGTLKPLVSRNTRRAEYVIQLPDWISAQTRWDLLSQAARRIWEWEHSPAAPKGERHNP